MVFVKVLIKYVGIITNFTKRLENIQFRSWIMIESNNSQFPTSINSQIISTLIFCQLNLKSQRDIKYGPSYLVFFVLILTCLKNKNVFQITVVSYQLPYLK